MSKMKEKFLAIGLLIVMLLNIIIPIAEAALTNPDPAVYTILGESDIDKSGSYAVYGLEYDVFDATEYKTNPTTATAKRRYKAGDVVKIRMTIKETDFYWTGLSNFQALVWYDTNVLEPISKSDSSMEDFNYPRYYNEWTQSDLEQGKISVTCPTVSRKTLKDGDWILEMIFIAKSNEPTSLTVFNIESDGQGSGDVYSEIFENANTPSITIPEQADILNYGIEITKTDEHGTAITDSEAIYKVTMPDGDVKYIATNNNGIGLLSGLEMPEGATDNTYTYRIEEIKAPEGYKIDAEVKDLVVIFEDDGTIEEAKIGTNAQTVSNNVIKLKFENEGEEEPKPEGNITFVINKKDENGNLITSSPASFAIEVDSGDIRYVTTTNGTVSKTVSVPDDLVSAKVYKINEVSAPSGYILDGQDIQINTTFRKEADNTVSVASATKLSGTNAVISKSGNTVTIDVTNEKEPEREPFKIKIKKVDEDGNVITADFAKFFVITPEGTSQVGSTSAGELSILGNIPLGDLNPEGYSFTIGEIKAPAGYKALLDEVDLKLFFEETAGRRQLRNMSIESDDTYIYDSSIDVATNTATIEIMNEKEVEDFTITLNKVDDNGDAIEIPNVYFTLENQAGEIATLITDAKGTAKYTGKMPETAGEYNYILKEVVAPSGYVLNNNNNTIKLNFAKVSGVMTLKGATVANPISKVGNITNNNLVIDFKNELEVPDETKTDFDLIITKEDEESRNPITTGTAIFQILDEEENPIGVFGTNASGVATIKLDLPETAGTVNYKLIEKVAPAGYVLDETEKTISITFVEDDGVIQIDNISLVGTNIVDKANTFTTASFSFLNELITPEEEPEYFELVINKKDEADLTKNIEESNVVFIITAPDDSNQTLRTDALGKISITEKVPDTEGTYTYEIQEIKAPTDYKLYAIAQYVDITFGIVDGKMQITDANVRGAKINKEFAGVNTDDESQVIVSVLNEKDVPPVPEIPEEYTIKLNKVDSKTLANIKQEGVIFKVKAGTEETYVATDAEGKLELTEIMPETAGTVRYEIEELKAPNGYKLLTTEQYLDITFAEDNGSIVIEKAEVVGNKIKATLAEKEVIISILNDEEEKQEEPEEPIKKEPLIFDFVINKADKETSKNIEQAGVVFKIVDQNNTISYLDTLKTGIASLKLEAPEKAGTYTYKVTELSAPTGYQKITGDLTVNVTFTEVDEKLEITNLAVNGGNKISAVKFDKELVEVKVLDEKVKEEVKQETPIKPSEPEKLPEVLPQTGDNWTTNMIIVVIGCLGLGVCVFRIFKIKK